MGQAVRRRTLALVEPIAGGFGAQTVLALDVGLHAAQTLGVLRGGVGVEAARQSKKRLIASEPTAFELVPMKTTKSLTWWAPTTSDTERLR